jgi:diacylglycerol kinase (ATP)
MQEIATHRGATRGGAVLSTLICNPAAGSGRARRALPRVLDVLRAMGHEPRVWETRGRGDAERLAGAVAEGEALGVLGGDGTLNEVINGLQGRAVSIALLPCGTGNDTARGLGLPTRAVAAARALAEARERAIDLGEANGRLFCNVAGVGLDGEVVRLLSTGSLGVRGKAAYAVAFLATAANLRASPVHIQVDGSAWQERETLMISCANGRSYGGGMRIAPDADPEDGHLDTCTILAIGRLALVRAFPRVYLGTHVTHPCVRMGRARELRLYGERPLPIQVDGEPAGRLSVDAERPTLICITGRQQRFLVADSC